MACGKRCQESRSPEAECRCKCLGLGHGVAWTEAEKAKWNAAAEHRHHKRELWKRLSKERADGQILLDGDLGIV